MQAAVVLRLQALDIKLVQGAPTFGDSVIIRKPDLEKTSFRAKGTIGTFMHWRAIVPYGAWVMQTKEDGTEKIDLVSLPRDWKRVEEKRWKLTRDPQF